MHADEEGPTAAEVIDPDFERLEERRLHEGDAEAEEEEEEEEEDDASLHMSPIGGLRGPRFNDLQEVEDHFNSGGNFYELVDIPNIRSLLQPRQLVEIMYCGAVYVVALVGQYEQFEEFAKILLHRQFPTYDSYIIDISGFSIHIYAAEVTDIHFINLPRGRGVRLFGFGFFEYDNQLKHVDHSHYQIYSSSDEVFDQETLEDPCIIHCLQLLGVKDDALHLIYANLSGYYMRKKDLS